MASPDLNEIRTDKLVRKTSSNNVTLSTDDQYRVDSWNIYDMNRLNSTHSIMSFYLDVWARLLVLGLINIFVEGIPLDKGDLYSHMDSSIDVHMDGIHDFLLGDNDGNDLFYHQLKGKDHHSGKIHDNIDDARLDWSKENHDRRPGRQRAGPKRLPWKKTPSESAALPPELEEEQSPAAAPNRSHPVPLLPSPAAPPPHSPPPIPPTPQNLSLDQPVPPPVFQDEFVLPSDTPPSEEWLPEVSDLDYPTPLIPPPPESSSRSEPLPDPTKYGTPQTPPADADPCQDAEDRFSCYSALIDCDL